MVIFPYIFNCFIWIGYDFDDLMQECSISSVLAMVILQSCTKPSIWWLWLAAMHDMQLFDWFQVHTGPDILSWSQDRPPEHGFGYEVTMNVTMPYQWLGHHVYCDNIFTSVHLVEALLERNTYLCGTIRANMSGIPEQLKKPGHLQQGQSIKWQKGNVVAVVWKDRRDVRVISSNANPTDGHVQREAPRNRNQVRST